MARVGVVTDSSADIPSGLARRLGIIQVPCPVYFGQEVFQDGIEFQPAAFYARMAASEVHPRTAQPPVGDLEVAYRCLLDAGGARSIVSIHPARSLSGAVNAAWSAAQLLPDPGAVEVVDSGQVSMGLGWSAVKAAEAAQAGADHPEVMRTVRALLPRARVVAMADTLDSLRRGGRINHLTAALGTLLHIRPILSVCDSQVALLDKERTRTRALDRLVEHVHGWGALEEMAVLHAGAEAAAVELADRLAETFPRERMVVTPAGTALTTHLGLGAVGVCALVHNGPRMAG